MKMTKKTADSLMDGLLCLAISAYGGISVNEQGDVLLDDEVREIAESYAQQKFVELCHDWEAVMGEKWEIEE